jgi:3-phenylpropionate/trans-cinnamate dioxygenase ferredoxin subunit
MTTRSKSARSGGAAQDQFVPVAKTDALPENSSLLVEVDDVRIALFNLAGEFYAIADVCTHDGGPLVEGTIVNGHEVKCPRHGARFDIRTGAALSFPAIQPTQTFAVRTEKGTIYVQAPA